MKQYCIIGILGVLALGACQEEINYPASDYAIVGTWLLYESGWSPGAGYFVDEIPRVPPQTITFRSDGKVRVEGELLASYLDYQYYRLTEDSVWGTRVRFSEKANFNDFYEVTIRVKPDTLTLHPLCYEGCHSAFLRVEEKRTD